MGNFNQGGKSWGNRGTSGGGGGGFRGGFGGGGGRGGFGDRPRPQMHRATCSDCGQECEVPFKPTGEKPVYCSNCFEGSGRGMSRPKRDDDRPRFDDRPKASGNQELKEQFDKLNAKLDRILKALAPVMPTEAKSGDFKKSRTPSEKEAKKAEVAETPAEKPAKKAVTKKVTKKETKKKK